MRAILVTQHRQVVVFCYLMLLLPICCVLPACTTRQMFSGQFAERMRELKSVSVAPPKVQIYDESSGNAASRPMYSAEKSAAGEINFANAVKRQFEEIGRFTVTNLDVDRDPQAAREYKFLTFWEPRDMHFIARSAPPCVPLLHPGSQERRRLLALREAAQADALLLTYGLSVDKSEEVQRKQSLALGIAYLFPYSAIIMAPLTLLSPVDTLQSAFGSGKSAVQICLIDAKTGEELWSYFGEFNGRDQLSDPIHLEAIVAEAFKNLPLVPRELKGK